MFQDRNGPLEVVLLSPVPGSGRICLVRTFTLDPLSVMLTDRPVKFH